MTRTAAARQAGPVTEAQAPARTPPAARNAAPAPDLDAAAERSLGHQLRRRLFLCRKAKGAGARDRFEIEADRMADAVVARAQPSAVESPLTSVGSTKIQALCEECEEEAKGAMETVQACACGGGRDSGGGRGHRHVDLDDPALRSGGRPLEATERRFLEPRFARDFGAVRVHTGPAAAGAAATLGARAFTRGRDVYFGAGEYAPGTRAGRWLLAHELSHVVQQGHAPALAGATPDRHSPAEVLSRLGEGEALPTATRHRMEGAFGTGLGDVRVHRDGPAAEVAGSLGAEAFAVGRHVGFAPGAYRPDTPRGAVVLAHEVAHVLQQRDAELDVAGAVSPEGRQSRDPASDAAVERDADHSAGDAVMSLWARAVGAAASVAGGAMPRLRTGLRLQRCATRTPSGYTLGPTRRRRRFCLKSGSFQRSFSTAENSTTAAKGQQVISFEGESTGERDGKKCDCDCGLYRQFVRGYFRGGSPTAPKRYEISSCDQILTMSETDWTEEHTGCTGGGVSTTCAWRNSDAPGTTGGLSEGLYLEAKLDFGHMIWDSCQGEPVLTRGKTLTINGSNAPRSITWT